MPEIHLFSDVADFINRLSESDAAKVYAHIEALKRGYGETLIIKSLKGKIKEIVVRQYRIVFFQIADTIYIADVFKKQSKKTPKRIIEKAERMRKQVNR